MRSALLLFVTMLSCRAQPRTDAIASQMLETLRGARWQSPYVANAGCSLHAPVQIDVYATVEWTHHCAHTSGDIVTESFYYVFGEPAGTSLLRVDVRPLDESPEFTGQLLGALRSRLTAKLGNPSHAPELLEIGFRPARYGQPVSGDHWIDGRLHYFLHANQSGQSPMGVRRGVELIVMEDRLMQERGKDDVILRLEGLGVEPLPDDEVRARLRALPSSVPADLLRRALAGSPELLWRVWNEFPNSDAGEMAFVELQNRGWNTDTREGCPANPDLFREVIVKGEAFLAAHPGTRFRKAVLYTLAAANESWWSTGKAAADDPIVSAPPYPRRQINARLSSAARERAIRYYREIVRLAPESAEAVSALRRLPRLELDLDTGQRRFFCFYC